LEVFEAPAAFHISLLQRALYFSVSANTKAPERISTPALLFSW
jgi:hypothetical protein